ncbi:MAG: MFS transporter [Sciscionella sp.]
MGAVAGPDSSRSGASKRPLTVEDITVTEPGVIRRAIGAAAIGNVTEWYDFGVYAYFEDTIRQVFFSGLPKNIGTIATLGLFAVAFLVRPFGGLFFGPLADRIGRNKVLSTTMILMALGTFCIGVIPSYHSIGVIAPLLVLLARLVQGFSTGGEYGNAMTFIAEYAPDKRRGFLGSWLEFGTLTGYVMGAVIVTVITSVMPEPTLLSWGWRIPFFVALPLGIVGLYLRLRLEDTPAYLKLAEQADAREKEQKASTEFRDILKLWPAMLVCGGLVLVWNVTNYMLTSYMPTYVTGKATGGGVSDTTSQILQIVVLAVLMVVVTFLGRLSDRIGRRPIIFTASVALIVLSIPSILLIRAGSATSIFFGLLIMGLMLVCFSATMPSTLPALFPTKVRAGALSIAFNIAVSLFGGTTSVVTASLISATGDLNWPGYYLIIAGAIGAVAIYLTKESARKPLAGSSPAAGTKEEAREIVETAR